MSEIEIMKPYVWLRTSDDSIQKVEEEIAMVCPFVCQEISQKGVGFSKSSAVCLPEKVSLAMLNIILNYCRFHHEQGHSYKERKLYDEEFVRIVDDRLCELSYAAFNLQLDPLIDLTCLALARKLKGSSTKEAREILNCPDELTEVETLEPFINMSSELSDRLSNHLERKKLEARERALENVGIEEEKEEEKKKEVHVVDERSIDELVSFINGSNDGEIKRKKKCKNKKKNRRKKKDQHKNSSLKEEDDHVVEFDDDIDRALMENIHKEVEKEDDPAVEFDDEIDDQALMIDREVEEFNRRLNCTWEERKRELLRDAAITRKLLHS